jgi:hypothetical protein
MSDNSVPITVRLPSSSTIVVETNMSSASRALSSSGPSVGLMGATAGGVFASPS